MPDKVNDINFFIKDPNKKARSLVRKVTHSGETDLNKEDLAELKQICRATTDGLMLDVYKECIKCLRKEHAQVRVSTLKLLDYLFQKSHVIRNKLLDEFDLFIELTLAITQRAKIKLKLPPPKKYATLLKELAAKTIHQWHADFGEGYEKLRYAHRFLREHNLVDFSRFQVVNQEQLIKQQRLAEQQEKILTRSIENRMKEYNDLKPEIQQILAQIESLIDILVPTTEDTLDIELDSDQLDPALRMQHHGIANMTQNIAIEFSPYVEVYKNAENKDLVRNLKDLKKELIESKLVKLISIEKTISKRSEKLLDTLKEIIDLKTRSTNLILKLGELKLIDDEQSFTLNADSGDEDEEDDEFQDVEPKDDLETYIPKSMRYEYGLEPIDPEELAARNRVNLVEESFDPTDSVPGPSTSDTGLAMACNVRLETGKLCPRRDKVKCPFHGKIIPRDHLGVPIDEDDRREEERRAKRKQNVPEWQDPQLLREIKAATGIDLTMPKRGGSNRISPKKNLVNPKTCDATPKQRLQRRLKALMR